MNRSLACLVAAGLALTAAGPTSVIASGPRDGLVEVEIDGAPQKRYAHDGRWYVEAIKGREYAIRLRNPYGIRVAVALSVDGLNTIDARRSTAANARKWVIDPYGSIRITGWQTSRTTARRFEFTTEERSYAQALGLPGDMGLISASYFRERRVSVTHEDSSDGQRAASPPQSGAAAEADARAGARARDEYAATGMGRETGHEVTQIRLDLEQTPADRVDIRYEFRPQLVRLGILPDAAPDPLRRRERATGFEPGFSPVPPQLR